MTSDCPKDDVICISKAVIETIKKKEFEKLKQICQGCNIGYQSKVLSERVQDFSVFLNKNEDIILSYNVFNNHSEGIVVEVNVDNKEYKNKKGGANEGFMTLSFTNPQYNGAVVLVSYYIYNLPSKIDTSYSFDEEIKKLGIDTIIVPDLR